MKQFEKCEECESWGSFCDGCDADDQEYIKEILERELNREISDDELCELCIEHEAYREVICERCLMNRRRDAL